MKNIKKNMMLAIALLMVISSFASCTNQISTSKGNSFTYWVTMDSNVAHTHTDFNELLMYQEIAKATGVEIDFIHPAQGSTGTEAFQILLSSGDYPDMIEYSWGDYAGGPDQAISDGVIISLNDYLKDYAPNYYDYMEGEAGAERDYLYKASAISDSGNYYGFKSLNVGNYKGFRGLYVRKDLLTKWGLDIPTTIDDWSELFKTAKENGIKYPLTGGSNIVGAVTTNVFNTAWEVGSGFYLEGNKVKFGPFQPEFKDYVAKMREWMELGYIDIDYVTNDTTIVRGQITNGISIAAIGYVGGDLGAIIPAMLDRDPEFELAACPFPVMKKGDTPIFQEIQADSSDPTIAISAQCGLDDENRYKDAISWCDYLYSDEGIVLKSFGVEGETFTIEKDDNGIEHYIYTDKVKNYEEFGATNMSAALYHFMLPANHPGFNQHPDYFNGFYEYDIQKKAIEVWNENVEEAQKHVMPAISFTGEEAARKANIETNGKPNLQAAISNIILGKQSMDSYDKVISNAKKAGYDELLKIYQTAYNRYLKVLKK